MRWLIHDYAGHSFQVQLSRALAQRGHEVMHAFAGSLETPRGKLTRRADDAPGFQVHEVAMDPSYPKAKYSFVRRRRMEVDYGRAVASLIRNWQPDAVLSANTPTEAQGFVIAQTTRLHRRFAYWVQDFYSLAVDKLVRRKFPLFGALIGRHYRSLDRRHFQASSQIVAITEDFVPILKQQFGVPADKVTVIPNWAPIDSLPVMPKDNAWAQRHGLQNQFVFLYSGTLGMKHNPDLLLQLALQHREDAMVRVIVISEGLGARWLLEQKSARGLENIEVLGYQPFEVMPQVLAAADVLVAVLEEDAGVFSVPSKVLTYLCAQRPLLLAVPRVNLAARIIEENQSGLCVAPSDAGAFLAAAARFRSDPNLAALLGANGRAYAEKSFRIETIAQQFEEILLGGANVHASNGVPVS